MSAGILVATATLDSFYAWAWLSKTMGLAGFPLETQGQRPYRSSLHEVRDYRSLMASMSSLWSVLMNVQVMATSLSVLGGLFRSLWYLPV